MSDDRAVRIGAAFLLRTGAARSTQLCGACVEVLDVSGAGITLMSQRNSGLVCSSDERVGRLEELQFTLGEGPCVDAFVSGAPVNEPDLALRSSPTWPNYSPPALDLGARGVFAYPLRIGDSSIGALTLYQDVAGPLTKNQHDDSVVVAAVLARTISEVQIRRDRMPLTRGLTETTAHRAEIHQASGMISVQLGVDVDEALVRLRAHAYATNRSIASVALDVVARRLRLDDDG